MTPSYWLTHTGAHMHTQKGYFWPTHEGRWQKGQRLAKYTGSISIHLYRVHTGVEQTWGHSKHLTKSNKYLLHKIRAVKQLKKEKNMKNNYMFWINWNEFHAPALVVEIFESISLQMILIKLVNQRLIPISDFEVQCLLHFVSFVSLFI